MPTLLLFYVVQQGNRVLVHAHTHADTGVCVMCVHGKGELVYGLTSVIFFFYLLELNATL